MPKVFRLALAAISLAAGLITGCAPNREAAAAPGATTKAAAAPLPPPPAPAKPPADDPASKSDALRAEIEAIDADVQRNLALLIESLSAARAERRTWTSIDRSVASARAANKALGARCKAVITIYDTQAATALARFKQKLKEAPPVLRSLAAVRQAQLKEAALDYERRNYQAMADMCEAAAALCERRHAELFGPADTSDSAVPPRANAETLAKTVENMRKLHLVHERWEETFAAYPSSLDEGRLSALFDHLSAYAEDLEAFTTGVEALRDVMKRPAGETRPAPKKEPPAREAASPEPSTRTVSAVIPAPQPVIRKLTPTELRGRIDAAVRRQLEAQRLARRGSGVYTLHASALPARLSPDTVYVVTGVPPAGQVPSNVVYDSEVLPQAT